MIRKLYVLSEMHILSLVGMGQSLSLPDPALSFSFCAWIQPKFENWNPLTAKANEEFFCRDSITEINCSIVA